MIVIKNRRLRTILRVAIPFVLLPLIAFGGTYLWRGEHFLLLSLLAAVLTVVLFLTGFEKKSVGARRLVIVAVLIALSIVGRLIPFFKPVTAVTVIAAIWLGGESGFLVGAFSALLSNFYFGQGPWTPFQMLAWGLIGLTAGALAQPLRKNRVFLLIFGVVSGILYSLVMDVWTVLWYGEGFSWSLYLTSTISALPHTALYAVSNFL
ncbi:MAG: ECF transporter S component, partial [Clostridia bacterium]|nr:ECF transporter S component [Clostridia bacterium]